MQVFYDIRALRKFRSKETHKLASESNRIYKAANDRYQLGGFEVVSRIFQFSTSKNL